MPWQVIRHDGDYSTSVISQHTDHDNAVEYAESHRRQLPSGSNTWFEVKELERLSLKSEVNLDRTKPYIPQHKPDLDLVDDCGDIRRQVLRQPKSPQIRAYLIRKAIEFGCRDAIPDDWTIEFTKS